MSEEELYVIEKAIKQAGTYLREHFGQTPKNIRKKDDSSPVTEFDLESNRIITEVIRESFPDHLILSEEDPGASTKQLTDAPTWIIDPLDGTSNYMAQIPLFAVAVAFIENKETIIGIIYDPLHDDLFVAVKGKGATLNGKPLLVSSHNSTRKAMLFAGRGYKERDRIRHGQIIFELEKQTSYFRRLGSAAIMLSSVAAGRADSVILTGNQAWDLAAGALLIQEAGGVVTEYCGQPWGIGSEDLVGTNGVIHDQLIAITDNKALYACEDEEVL
jgi:myo-inositol-1(or 4)-monophosphatase